MSKKVLTTPVFLLASNIKGRLKTAIAPSLSNVNRISLNKFPVIGIRLDNARINTDLNCPGAKTCCTYQ